MTRQILTDIAMPVAVNAKGKLNEPTSKYEGLHVLRKANDTILR